MNNDQFRKLVQSTPRNTGAGAKNGAGTAAAAAAPALGSRMKSSIPMTPRSVGGYNNHSNDFARQLAERNASQQQQQQGGKKFRATAAPRGAKLPAGYVDRARARDGDADGGEGRGDGEESDKVQRVRALEEMMKLSQIDEETFIKLREEILGEDVGERAGLVKGLDWRLLERVRRGEVGVADVLDGGRGKGDRKGGGGEGDGEEVDVDDAFDELEAKDLEALVKDTTQKKKKGELAPSELTGRKRTRDQILAEMKAARLAAKEAAQPSLGARFKKVGEKRTESRIERDGKGREVLITTDEHGNEKRKVRRVQIEEKKEPGGRDLGLLMPDKDAKPLGMEVPDIPKKAEEEEEDIDIFDDVGDDYDPLAGLLDGEESDAEVEVEAEVEEGEVPEDQKPKSSETTEEEEGEAKESKSSSSMPPPPPPRPKQPQPPAPRDYFGGGGNSKPKDKPSQNTDRPKALTDPTLLAAIKKASTLNPLSNNNTKTGAESEEQAAKEARRKKMLQRDDRDAQDMDMGFGSSRFEDEEDFEEKKVKLSEWGGKDDDDEGGKGGKGEGGKRKRGPKKRKGDANSAADVLAVLERRKGEKK